MKFNITLNELEEAVLYAKNNGSTHHKTITIHYEKGGISGTVYVSEGFDTEKKDITDVDSW